MTNGFRFFKEGTMWGAVAPDFVDLMTSPAGFGATKDAARAALIADFAKNARESVRPHRFPAVEEFQVGDAGAG